MTESNLDMSETSRTTILSNLYQLAKQQSKFKFYQSKLEWNMEELNPYAAGEWMNIEPKAVRSTHTNEVDIDKGTLVVSESKDKGTIVECISKGTTVECVSKGTTVECLSKGTTVECVSKDEESKEEGEKMYEPDDDRSKRVHILRGPVWNYGVRKMSSDVDYYNNILFGLPWNSNKTPDDLILRGTSWVPSKTITSSMAKFVVGKLKKMGYEKTSLVELETGRSLSYGEMADKIESLAWGLHCLGVKEQQIMALVSYHSLEAHLMLLACMLVGAVAALVDSSLNPVELGIVLRITSPHFLFTEPGKTLQKVTAALSYLQMSLHSSKPLLIINSTGVAPSSEYTLFTQLFKELDPLRPIPGPRKAEPLRPVLILYTGVGDNLKACLIPERSFSLSMAFVDSVLPNADEPSITVMVTPPMYCALAIKTVFNHYIDGHRIILCRGPIPDPSLLTALRKFEVFALLTLRSTLMALLDWPARPRCPQLKLVAVTGVPLRLKNLKKVSEELFKNKVQILQLWGLVETGTAASNTFLENKHGSVGKLFYNVEMKVLEEGTGQVLGADQEGELCVRSPTMMVGYYNNPEANKEVIDHEGFIHTGDLGYYDEDGFVHVTDQVREMIKWRTYLVSPSLVEETLMELPAIKEALVFGLFDEEDGELVSAAVVLESEYEDIELSDLARQANALLLDRRKIRGGIYVFDQFPRSTIGKPMKEHILKEVMERKLLSQRRRSTE